MLYIDSKYVGQISYKLRNFKKKNDYYWNFSCPICGDSKKNSLKARGFVFKHDNRLVYKCHNCGISTSIGNLIKQLDPLMYNEYVLERYKESTSNHTPHAQIKLETPTLPQQTICTDLIKAGAVLVKDNEQALEYVKSRKIPETMWKDLYYAAEFKKFVNNIKFHYPKTDYDAPRLIIPFYDQDNKLIAFQGRAFGKEMPKYVTIKLDESKEKIFGLDRMNPDKRIYVTEGPIDSMFIPNAIAVAGAGFDTKFIQAIKDNATLIMDNEPRSKEICKFIEKLIDEDYSVCLWPETVLQKDINEMVMAGKSIESIMDTINTNTFQGMEAKLKFIQWRKC
jgi:transcription elongation factor Elf1